MGERIEMRAVQGGSGSGSGDGGGGLEEEKSQDCLHARCLRWWLVVGGWWLVAGVWLRWQRERSDYLHFAELRVRGCLLADSQRILHTERQPRSRRESYIPSQ